MYFPQKMDNWFLTELFDLEMADVSAPRSLIPPKLKLTIVQDDQLDNDAEYGPERIPFTESTNLHKLTDLDKQNRILRNKSKENSPKRVASPRSRLRFQNNEITEQSALSNMEPTSVTAPRPTTPTPESEDQQAPLTPTANLKMLFSAMSPELRNREKKKELFTDDDMNSEQSKLKLEPLEFNIDTEISSSQEADWKPGSRKEKSLGLLCQKFLQKYPEYPTQNENHAISLDEVAKELAVERRRIYDIVNVLESVEIVSRIAKNKYAWHGKTNLVNTLGKLKALGEAEGFAEQLRKVKDYELNRELEEQNSSSMSNKSDNSTNTEEGVSGAALRKDKSLGIMSQKFLMLFLVSEPRTVNLDLAAKILIGDPNIDRTENAKFKTKIRRLYDIANILTSLDLIRKVHVTEIRGRKPAFKYIGPEVDNMKDISVCYNDGYHRPSSRHSLLDCVKNHQVADMMCPYKPIKPNVPGKSGEDDEKMKGKVLPMKKSFSRTASFDQICEIAEQERSRLYGSMSQPSSPTAEFAVDSSEFRKSLSQEEISKTVKKSLPEKGKTIILQRKTGRYHVLRSDDYAKVAESLPVKDIKKTETKSLPRETSVPKETVSAKPELSRVTDKVKADAIVMKTSQINKKQATMIPLTKDQIDAVLKSLKVPVPITKNLKKPGAFREVVEVTDKQKPKSQVVETKTLVCSLDKGIENSHIKTRLTTVECVANKIPPSPSDGNLSMQNASQEVETESVKCSLSQVGETSQKRPYQYTVEPVNKKFKIDFPSPPSDGDSPVPVLSAKPSKEKLSPQRALNFTPEFRETPPLAKIAKLNENVSGMLSSDVDLDLAVPLPDSQDSCDSTSIPQTKSAQSKNNIQRITVQLPNQSPTILQFPFAGVSVSNEIAQKTSPGQSSLSPRTQQMQIIQGVPLTATGMQGQPINFMVPVTFSPPLTPHSEQSSPTMFSFPSSSPPQCNGSVVNPSTSLQTLTPDTMLSSINGKPTVSQFVTPTERPVAPPTKFFGHTPGGILSPSNSLLTNSSKEMYSTARKLDLKLDLQDMNV